jgi:hypothetical protein
MSNRNNVQVVRRGPQWGTHREGSARASGLFNTQGQAIYADAPNGAAGPR